MRKSELEENVPKQSRKRKLPHWWGSTDEIDHSHDTPKSRYRQIYFDAIEHVVNSIQEWFCWIFPIGYEKAGNI